ncbi:MAG: hypothetical protein ACRDZY_23060, partial [Acidimicrobiales bacterium]
LVQRDMAGVRNTRKSRSRRGQRTSTVASRFCTAGGRPRICAALVVRASTGRCSVTLAVPST